MKSSRSARKRFKFTGTGKIKRSKAYRRHILSSKTTKRKRKLRKSTLISKADHGRIKKLITA
jgi:large subunit ribosomal protein L35